jgi:hypothetical protein
MPLVIALKQLIVAPNNCSFNFKYRLSFAAAFNAHFDLAGAPFFEIGWRAFERGVSCLISERVSCPVQPADISWEFRLLWQEGLRPLGPSPVCRSLHPKQQGPMNRKMKIVSSKARAF